MAECTEICQIWNWWWIRKQQCSFSKELRGVSDNSNLIYTNLSATTYVWPSMGLCAHKNLPHFGFWSFITFVPKHSLSMKYWHLVQHTMGNLMQFTKLVAIAYKKWNKWNNRKRYILCTQALFSHVR